MVGVAALAVGTVACGIEPPTQPTLGSIDFTPELVLSVTDTGVQATPGPRANQHVRTNPPTVPSGTVVEVRNAAARDQRLQGGAYLDTGILRPGEHMTAVLTNTTGNDVTVDLRDPLATASRGSIVILSAPPTDG